MTAAPKDPHQTCCAKCGGVDVEICLPAHFRANGTLDVAVSVDTEAEALTYWCPTCKDNVPARLPDGEIVRGRWDLAD